MLHSYLPILLHYYLPTTRGLLVSGISINECKELLEIANANGHSEKVVDYHNGKPVKLGFHFRRNGGIITSSSAYDERNGKYRFLEALLNVFNLDEIMITKKGYNEFLTDSFKKKGTKQPESRMIEFAYMLKNTKKVKDQHGTYWKFDLDAINYKSPFM